MANTRKTPVIRSLCALLAALVLLGLLCPITARAYSEQEYYQNAVLFWVNTERERHGLSTLRTTAKLNQAADVRASEIVSRFEHVRPNGTAPYTVLSNMGIGYTSAGENIAAGYFSPCDVVSGWMNSSGHRANILNPDFTFMGVGYDYVGSTSYKAYWAQFFTGGVEQPSAKSSFYVAPTAVALYYTDSKGRKLDADNVAPLRPGYSYTLIAELQPSYATASVSCVSSDDSVLKVSGVEVNRVTVTCVGEGTATLTAKCGSAVGSLSVSVLSSGHKHSYVSELTAPTCTAPGYTTHTCSGCGSSYVDGSVAALGHSWDGGTVTKEPTEAESGERTYTCTRCGETRTAKIPDLSHEHSFTSTVTEPTCTEAGHTTYVCACGESYTDDFTDALGHDYENGKCTRCGSAASDGLTPVSVLRFSDVGRLIPDFRESIAWAVGKGITTGYPDGSFRPNDTCTRAHVVTFLWRAEGSPAPKSLVNPFKDVSKSSPFYEAILWAAENGITSGYSDGSFRPNAACTRAHVVTFLWRYENRPTALEPVSLTDIAGLNADFTAAIRWAASGGITAGYPDGSFKPNAVCTRAHVVTFLYRDIG